MRLLFPNRSEARPLFGAASPRRTRSPTRPLRRVRRPEWATPQTLAYPFYLKFIKH